MCQKKFTNSACYLMDEQEGREVVERGARVQNLCTRALFWEGVQKTLSGVSDSKSLKMWISETFLARKLRDFETAKPTHAFSSSSQQVKIYRSRERGGQALSLVMLSLSQGFTCSLALACSPLRLSPTLGEHGPASHLGHLRDGRATTFIFEIFIFRLGL